METYLFGTAVCRGLSVRYYLLQQRGGERSGQYGIRVEYQEEAVTVMGLTASEEAAEGLLRRLVRGCVTPVTVPDVIEDWLLE